jgi:hypothetical protein
MNNYNQPSIPEDVLWVNNSIIKSMDLKKIKASRTTDTYPDKTFVIKMSQIKSQRKNASITFWTASKTRSFPPTQWNPNGRSWTYRPKSVTNIYFDEDAKEYTFSWGSGGEINEAEFYSLFKLSSSVKEFLESI